MTRRNDFLIPTLAVCFDALAIEGAFVLSYFVRFHTSLLKFLPLNEVVPPLQAYIAGSLIVIPIWLLMFNYGEMYGARRNTAPGEEFVNVIKYVTLGMLIVMSAAFFYRSFSYSRVVFVLLWVTSVVLLFLDRLLLYQIEKSLHRHGKDLRNAIIVGNNETALKVFRTLNNHPLLGYQFVGYVADETSANKNLPLETLGALTQIVEILKNKNIELALIILEQSEHDKLYRLIHECEGINVEFMMVPDFLELMTSGMQVKEIEGIPFIKIKGTPMTTWGSIIKRSFDLALAMILLVVTSPILLVVPLFIKLDSRGGVFFRQPRIGIDGKEFTIIKFRSMVSEAPQYDASLDRKVSELTGNGIKDKAFDHEAAGNDSRVTRLGRILRATSIDELPQLINVLRGEMSLVGPRPERPRYVEHFKELIPKYLDRHRVKTGMTGWAQVNGLRGDSSLEERIRYDLYYIENWSMGFDFRILLKTFGAVINQMVKQASGNPQFASSKKS